METQHTLPLARMSTLAHPQMPDWLARSQGCILHIRVQSPVPVPHNHSPTNAQASQLHVQGSLGQVHGLTERDMKSLLASHLGSD